MHNGSYITVKFYRNTEPLKGDMNAHVQLLLLVTYTATPTLIAATTVIAASDAEYIHKALSLWPPSTSCDLPL